ncbi:MAG: M20/M25/M40 family metallo-hydrolase [Thermodesulfobacteriota bacterium]
MHPETAYEEVRTTERIASVLTGLGLDVQRFDDVTGVVGLLGSGKKGRTVALRADIDALNLQELNKVPYKSRTDGKMHACGHDAHATIMLGCGRPGQKLDPLHSPYFDIDERILGMGVELFTAAILRYLRKAA